MHTLKTDTTLNKQELYLSLLPQIEALCSGESDLISNLSNITAALRQQFNWWWVGFYFVKNNELILGPFQGTVACTRIGFGKGVCGTAWKNKSSIIVDDVEKFPGHIACSSESKSEIAVPVKINDEVVAILDVDSENLSYFDETDKIYLEKLANFIATIL